MKINWRTIERVIYLVTILFGVIGYFVSQGKKEATIEAKLISIEEKVDNNAAKLEKHGDYWLEQNNVNGKVITALGIE